MLEQVAGLEVPDFSFQTFDEFEKSRKEISRFVHRVLRMQEGIDFVAEKKIGIDGKKWQEIFKIIDKSREKNNFQPGEIVVSGGFAAKLFLIFGDKQLVGLLLLLVESGILSISDSRVNEVLLELENKLHAVHTKPGIDLLSVRDSILKNGGTTRYMGVITDDYFDRKDILLKKNGGRQLRVRERTLTDQRITETLTGKRKFGKLRKEREYVLSKFFEKLGTDIDIEKIEKFMKILLEDEMDIHDMNALIEIFELLGFYMNRSKIKLRASMELNDTKFELEYYPGIKASKSITGEMRPFIEQEAPNLDAAKEQRELIGLYGDEIILTTSGSEGAFKFDGAEDAYMKFGRGGTLDSRVHLQRDKIKREAMKKMYGGYFNNFQV
ncbi:hypothetical protein LAT59_03170 [Candidatus Gracilibacteria bacterium]|nr:hypothetical protein [Candidatus Gracilibacteria bacterium]